MEDFGEREFEGRAVGANGGERRRATWTCYVISEDSDFDGKFTDLSEAWKSIYLRGMGTIWDDHIVLARRARILRG